MTVIQLEEFGTTIMFDNCPMMGHTLMVIKGMATEDEIWDDPESEFDCDRILSQLIGA